MFYTYVNVNLRDHGKRLQVTVSREKPHRLLEYLIQPLTLSLVTVVVSL